MTKLINGGTHGLTDRKKRYRRALNILKNQSTIGFMSVLRKGSRSAQVAKVQRLLGIGDDGIFGSGTEKAVKNWQQSHGLVADGIIGSKTWGKMFG